MKVDQDGNQPKEVCEQISSADNACNRLNVHGMACKERRTTMRDPSWVFETTQAEHGDALHEHDVCSVDRHVAGVVVPLKCTIKTINIDRTSV